MNILIETERIIDLVHYMKYLFGGHGENFVIYLQKNRRYREFVMSFRFILYFMKMTNLLFLQGLQKKINTY